ncbi:MAG: ASPIC/UnbV domain-containing protein [Acidobacteriota bacterium]
MDYDNDGDQDLMVFTNGGTARLFRNDLSSPDAHWLRVFLSTQAAPDLAPGGIGAVVRLTIGGRTLLGRIDGGSNYLSQSEMSAHFGLGSAATVDELRVEWPNGDVTTLTDVAADQTLSIEAPGSLVFRDTFETGTLAAWSGSVP